MTTTFVVGGVPRSGKSTLQKYMLEKYFISGLNTDLLREGFKYGVPDFGIKGSSQGNDERTEILWPYFKGILEARQWYKDKLLIEGTHFKPQYLAEFSKYPYIKMCFMGFADVDPQVKFKAIRDGEKDNSNSWTDDMTDQELMNLVKHLIARSAECKLKCEEFGLKYFDTSIEFDQTIKEAADYLLKDD